MRRYELRVLKSQRPGQMHFRRCFLGEAHVRILAITQAPVNPQPTVKDSPIFSYQLYLFDKQINMREE